MRSRVDAVVVGAGAAGCVLAARLSERPGRTVALVEAGPDYGAHAEGRWPADLLDARRLAFSHSWERHDPDDRSQLRARVVGGCSAHNACVALVGPPEDYDAWGAGWTWRELEPYVQRARQMLGVRTFAPRDLSPWHAACAQAGGDATMIHPVNARGTVRWSTAFAYLDAARPRANLEVIADTLADRVLLDGDRAVGVATSRGDLRAGLVVLAGGAYGSPAVLLRSGIGPGSGLPVGEGLSDHVGAGLGFAATSALQTDTNAFATSRPVYMAQVSLVFASTRCGEAPFDTLLFPGLDPGKVPGTWEVSAAAFAMAPRSLGRVSLRSPDPREPPLVEHGFLADEHDLDVVREGIERLRALASQDAVRRYAGAETRPGPGVAAEAHVRATARGFFHPTGTCAIGRVVDPDGRVNGHDRLVVADASIMPAVPRVNTHLTTVALAERIAERIDAAA